VFRWFVDVEKEIKYPRRLDDTNISNRDAFVSVFGWEILIWFWNPESRTTTFCREVCRIDDVAWQTAQMCNLFERSDACTINPAAKDHDAPLAVYWETQSPSEWSNSWFKVRYNQQSEHLKNLIMSGDGHWAAF